jgi:hypothetical protein
MTCNAGLHEQCYQSSSPKRPDVLPRSRPPGGGACRRVMTLCPQRSAIEIASGRLFAGRPPAWTLPRRPHRRSPGAKRPLRRGFNRMPEIDRTVQRLKSPLEGFSPGVHLRGRCHGDRIGGRPARSVLLAVSTACLSSYLSGSLDRTVQRLKSPLEGFSPGVHLRGRCHDDRIGGRPARSVLSGAVSTACLRLTAQFSD